jgi:hypothetical protein
MRTALPDPTGPGSRAESLALDRAVVACEALLGVPVGRYPDRRRLLPQLYRLALSHGGSDQ